MILDIFTLRKVASVLNNLISGRKIVVTMTFDKGKFVAILDNEGALECSFLSNLEFVNYVDSFRKPDKNAVNTLTGCNGNIIEKVQCSVNDRILELQLDNGNRLLIVFIRSKMNILLTDSGLIIDAFKNSTELTLTQVSDFLPEPENRICQNTKDFVKSNFFHFNKFVRAQVLRNINIYYEDELNDSLRDQIKDAFDQIEKPEPKMFYSYKNGHDIYISPIEITNGSVMLSCSTSFHEIFEDTMKSQYRIYKERTVKEFILRNKHLELRDTIKKINSLSLHKVSCENSDELLGKGNLILSNLNNIKVGTKIFKCKDLSGRNISIKLKPELNATGNARLYFNKYKGQRESLQTLERRLEGLRVKREKIEKEIDELNQISDFKSIVKMEKKYFKEKTEEDIKKLFRRFKIGGNYEVWVGKNSRSNDLLTTSFSSPHDLWFHVRGFPGSHTVLRIHAKGIKVDKDIITLAASIAAYYSKARNASRVLVSYCERKYVKKKKGFSSGTVVMEREKVITVKPKLPEED